MNTTQQEMILAPEFNLPRQTSWVKGQDGRDYLQFNTHMVTFYQQTYGELSRFFEALREGKLIGSHCPRCQQVMVPAATWHCPMCNFLEMKEIELPQQGVLAATAPITIFPAASFLGQAPFCRGYIDVATWAPTRSFLPSRLQTTTGLPRPGIFVKGVELKLVFREKRIGSILDIFWVPLAEVPESLRGKELLLESELNFESPQPPELRIDPQGQRKLDEALKDMITLVLKAGKSPRARKDLAGRDHKIGVKTPGGELGFLIKDGELAVVPLNLEGVEVDFTMVAQDPRIFSTWVKDGSLTDAAVEGTLWLPHRKAFEVLPVLDRLPRSVRRDIEEGKLED